MKTNNSPLDFLATLAIAIGLFFCGMSAMVMDRIYPVDAGMGWFIGAALICIAIGCFGFLAGAELGKIIWSKMFKMKGD